MDNDYITTGTVWFFLIFANAALAAALGRSRLLVGMCSVILGPLVTVYLAIAGRRLA
ncbi:hypothetical protein [Gryllotalpicola koreensis]|uniref:Uncharacterized protein n=1 Tax=Gryllotalpicola koreensis TaxID=993086 RepID=A0ABP8ACY3_9MICO